MGNKSVVDLLKCITDMTVATPFIDENYEIIVPETMQEEIDSYDESGMYSFHLDSSHANIIFNTYILWWFLFVVKN